MMASVKELPIIFSGSMVRAILRRNKTQTRRIGFYDVHPGDRLWVRETWRLWQSASFSDTGEPLDPAVLTGSLAGKEEIWLCSRPREFYADTRGEGPWRPSIHLPRWASRILLGVLTVHEERLQDITEQDAKAEGAEKEFEVDLATFLNQKTNFNAVSTYRFGFKHLWDSINAKRGYGWGTNPLVKAIGFEILEVKR